MFIPTLALGSMNWSFVCVSFHRFCGSLQVFMLSAQQPNNLAVPQPTKTVNPAVPERVLPSAGYERKQRALAGDLKQSLSADGELSVAMSQKASASWRRFT